MIKAYIILAHKHPEQLQRLIKALDDGRSFFYIHIDRSSDISLFNTLQFGCTAIKFLPREKTTWASLGIVNAILHGLRAVRASGCHFRQVILLSGQCYPIRSNAFIDCFVEQHTDKVFLEYYHLPAPHKWQPGGGLYRVNKYFIGLKAGQRFCSRSLNLLSRYFSVLKRKLYGNMEPYAGSMWWMLNRQAVDYILDFVSVHPRYTAFHRYTFAPDEVFFHMILLNAKQEALPGMIVNTDKRFIKWKNITAAHPDAIGRDDLPQLIGSDALFARKFDGQRDADILDLIDNYRLSS